MTPVNPESLSRPIDSPSIAPTPHVPPILDQQRMVAKHRRSRVQPSRCSVCGASNMKVQEEIVPLPTAHEESSGQPMINVVWKYCGHVLHPFPSPLGFSIQ